MDSKTQKKPTEHAATSAADEEVPAGQPSQRTQAEESEPDEFELADPAAKPSTHGETKANTSASTPSAKPTLDPKRAFMGSKPGSKSNRARKEVPIGQHAARRRAFKYQKDDVCKFTTAASLRITQKGGCKTRDRATKGTLSMIANKFIEAIAAGAIAYTKHADRKTVAPGDVINALRIYNRKCYGYKD